MAGALLGVALASFCLPAMAAGVQAAPDVVVTPASRAWEPFGLVDRVRIHGDFERPRCPSTSLFRLYPGTRVPPHAASVDRTYVVLSGSLRVGIGKDWDESRLRTLPAGSFVFVPANTSTFEQAEGEVVCQVGAAPRREDCPVRREPLLLAPGEIPWSTSGGVERAVLLGDPATPRCPAVVRYRAAAGRPAGSPDGARSLPFVCTLLPDERAVPGGTAEQTSGPGVRAGSVVVRSSGSCAELQASGGLVVQEDAPGEIARACKR